MNISTWNNGTLQHAHWKWHCSYDVTSTLLTSPCTRTLYNHTSMMWHHSSLSDHMQLGSKRAGSEFKLKPIREAEQVICLRRNDGTHDGGPTCDVLILLGYTISSSNIASKCYESILGCALHWKHPRSHLVAPRMEECTPTKSFSMRHT